MAKNHSQRGSLSLYCIAMKALMTGNSAPVGYRMKQFRLLPVRGNIVRQNKRQFNIFTLFRWNR